MSTAHVNLLENVRAFGYVVRKSQAAITCFTSLS